MPELTGISCSTCGQAFASKRALSVHSRYCASVSVSHNVRDVLRHGRRISSSSLRKTKIARTSGDINHAIRSSAAVATAGGANAGAPAGAPAAAGVAAAGGAAGVAAAGASAGVGAAAAAAGGGAAQSPDFDGEDTPSDSESLSSVLDGLDPQNSCDNPNHDLHGGSKKSMSSHQPLQPSRMSGTFQLTHAFK